MIFFYMYNVYIWKCVYMLNKVKDIRNMKNKLNLQQKLADAGV